MISWPRTTPQGVRVEFARVMMNSGSIDKGGANVILDVFVFLHFLTVRFDCQSPEFGFNPDVVVPIDIPIDSFFDLGYWLPFEGVKWFVYEDLMKGFDYDHDT